MDTRRLGRRLLSGLAGSTPAFAQLPAPEQRTVSRRLLSALAGSTPAFTSAPIDEFRSAAATPGPGSEPEEPKIELKIYIGSPTGVLELQEWLSGRPEVTVRAVPQPTAAGAMGSGWDFLSVRSGTGGPLAAAIRALQLWIESQRGTIEIVVGARRFAVGMTNAAVVLPTVMEVARALASAEEESEADGSAQ
ncbi:effector-associated constant component EACC1 [Nocardia sp. BMG111209]|uniref:effector-associated constant component EACC1 n=1 Tax=Nocardia sp. BMG111209 TaxID=1160137 RepID=UPI00035EB770|nr:hypothetical protein [Nocardia sp. BMG111209]